jgi:hypothetical protein
VKRPSFQFYPADWRNNAKLRRCSEAARGAWLDVLCLLHDMDEYGVCRWPLAELARAAGIPLKLAKELVSKDVLKGADKSSADYIFTPTHAGKAGKPVTLVTAGDGPCWYCSRFVRDEYVRQRRGNSTRFTTDNQPGLVVGGDDYSGEPKDAPNDQPKPIFGGRQGDGPTSPSSLKTNPPIPPKGGEQAANDHGQRRKAAICFQTYLDDCRKAGIKPIPEGHAVFTYAEKVGIPSDFLRLHWQEFKDRYTMPDSKRYKSWATVFHKSVKGNWFRLWYASNDGAYALTTTGLQAQRDHGEAA